MPSLVFVYGSLMRASPHPVARRLRQGAGFMGAATFQGRLYDVGDYPAVVESAQPHDIVHGEVFALRDSALLPLLDAYEECGPDDAQPTLYVRVPRPVRLATGGTVMAFIYLWQRPVAGLRRIASGRYRVRR